MTVTTFKWSIEQWHRLIETGVLAGQNVELLEGEIVKMSPEGIPHSFSNRSIGDYFRNLFQGLAYISERYPITLDDSEPQPDLAVSYFAFKLLVRLQGSRGGKGASYIWDLNPKPSTLLSSPLPRGAGRIMLPPVLGELIINAR